MVKFFFKFPRGSLRGLFMALWVDNQHAHEISKFRQTLSLLSYDIEKGVL